MSRVASLIASLVVGMLAREVHAQTQGCEDMERQIERGFHLRQRGQENAAWIHFRDLQLRCPTPRLTAQLGLVEHGIHRWVDARRHLREALSARFDSWILPRQSALRAVLTEVEGHIGLLQVESNDPEAELFIAGVSQGRVPLAEPLAFGEGSVDLELRAPERAPLRQTVTMVGGRTEHLTLAFPVRPVPIAAVTVAPPLSTTTPDVRPGARSPLRVVGWVTLGVSALALGMGGYFWWSSANTASSMTEALPTSPEPYGAWARFQGEINLNGLLSGSEVCARAPLYPSDGPRASDAVRSAGLCDGLATDRALAYAFGITGIVGAATGALLVVLGNRPSAERSRAHLTLAPWLASSPGLTAHFTF